MLFLLYLGMQICEVGRYLKVACFPSKLDNSSWTFIFLNFMYLLLYFLDPFYTLSCENRILQSLFGTILCLITRGIAMQRS